MTNATLMAHCGATLATREELKAIPTPEPMGRFHKPIGHYDFVDTLTKVLTDRGITIKSEEFAVQRGAALIFGTMDFDPASPGLADSFDLLSNPDRAPSLGFRGSNDQTLPRELAVGGRIFVCDNLCFAPGLIALHRKQTIGFDLLTELATAVDRYIEQTRDLEGMIERAQGCGLGDDKAKGLILDAFTKHEVLPVRFLPRVARDFFDPAPEATDLTTHPRTLWALHNAFTRSARDLKAQRRFEATSKLGDLLAYASRN